MSKTSNMLTREVVGLTVFACLYQCTPGTPMVIEKITQIKIHSITHMTQADNSETPDPPEPHDEENSDFEIKISWNFTGIDYWMKRNPT